MDVRPDKGMTKVRSKNRWEIQLDSQTGMVLHAAYRRSDIFNDIHEGTWFFQGARLWIFLPSGIAVFILWITGMVLYFKKRRKA